MADKGGKMANTQMVRDAVIKAYRKALEKLYTHKASVYERKMAYNSENFTHEEQDMLVYENIPCRISFDSKDTAKENLVTDSLETVTMFTEPDIEIKESSLVAARVNGKTFRFKYSSPPAIYPTHREYRLEYVTKVN